MRFLMITVALFWLAATTTHASEVVWSDSTAVDKPSLITRTAKLLDANGQPRTPEDHFAWLAHQDYKPRKAPTDDSELSGAEPIAWLKKVNLLYDEGKNFPYVLIGEGSVNGKLEFLGWVPRRYLITELMAKRSGTSTVYRKASVINSQAYVDKFKNFQPAEYRTKPDLNAKAENVMRVMSINFIWGETDPGEPDKGFYLLGDVSAFSLNDISKPTLPKSAGISGWVPKDRVILWETREGLMWDDTEKRQAPVKAYRTDNDAIRALDGEVVETNTEEEPFQENGMPRKWPVNQPRHPILPMERISKDGKKEIVFVRPIKNNNLRRIAYVGDVINSNNERILTAEAIQAFKQKIADSGLAIHKAPIEMLFVIDDTRSMEEWFGKATKAIDSVIGSIEKTDRALRVGFTFFTDVPVPMRATDAGRRRAVNAGELMDVKSEAYKLAKANLAKGRGAFADDSAEQVFAGITVGIEQAKWDPKGDSRRIVILLGDTRDHANLRIVDGKEQADEEGKRLKSQVVAALTPIGRPIEFYAYQVTEGKDVDQRAFLDQMDIIAKEVNRISVARNYPARAQVISGKTDLAGEIQKYYDQAARDLAEYEAALQDLNRGSITRDNLNSLTNPDMLALVRQFMNDRIRKGENLKSKSPRQLLEELARSVQVYEERYVWERDRSGKPQTRVQLLFNREELQDIEKMLSLVFERRPVPTPKEIAEGLVKAQAGDRETNPKEFDERRKDMLRELRATYGREKSDEELLSFVKGNTLLMIKYGVASRSPLLERGMSELEKNQETKDHSALFQDLADKLTYIKEGLLKDQQIELQNGEVKVINNWRTNPKDTRWHTFGEARSGVTWVWLDALKEWP